MCATPQSNFRAVSRALGYVKEGAVAEAFEKCVRGKDIRRFKKTARFSAADCHGIDFVYEDKSGRWRKLQVKSSLPAAVEARHRFTIPVVVIGDGMSIKEIANLLRQVIYHAECKIAFRVGDYAAA